MNIELHVNERYLVKFYPFYGSIIDEIKVLELNDSKDYVKYRHMLSDMVAWRNVRDIEILTKLN